MVNDTATAWPPGEEFSAVDFGQEGWLTEKFNYGIHAQFFCSDRISERVRAQGNKYGPSMVHNDAALQREDLDFGHQRKCTAKGTSTRVGEKHEAQDGPRAPSEPIFSRARAIALVPEQLGLVEIFSLVPVKGPAKPQFLHGVSFANCFEGLDQSHSTPCAISNFQRKLDFGLGLPVQDGERDKLMHGGEARDGRKGKDAAEADAGGAPHATARSQDTDTASQKNSTEAPTAPVHWFGGTRAPSESGRKGCTEAPPVHVPGSPSVVQMPEPRKLSEAPPVPLPRSVAVQPVAANGQYLSMEAPPVPMPRLHSAAGKVEIDALYEAPPVPLPHSEAGQQRKPPQEAPPVPPPQSVAERMQPDTSEHPSMAKTPSGHGEGYGTVLQRWWNGVMETASPTLLGLTTLVLPSTNRLRVSTRFLGAGLGLIRVSRAAHVPEQPGSLDDVMNDNFAAIPAAPSATPQASSAHADARERARLATQRARAGTTFAGAPEVLDANTDPAPGGAGADTAGNPQ